MQDDRREIQITTTIDVEAIERRFSELWAESAAAVPGPEEVLLRSRVASLMIFISRESEIDEIRATLSELSKAHPCRALMMVGDRETGSQDIEVHLSAACRSEKSRIGQLCCEEITLIARGDFVYELPSVAIPLLVPDLPVFLWWRDELRTEDDLFTKLVGATNRIIIDSVEFNRPESAFAFMAQLFHREQLDAAAITDINWARLTSWRALLANFYDVENYHDELEQINTVTIDFVPQEPSTRATAAQAMLIAAWLASRLGWSLAAEPQTQSKDGTISFRFAKDERQIDLQLKSVERTEMRPGRLAKVELKTATQQPASFLVSRSANGRYLQTEARIGDEVYPGRVLPVRNRSTSELLSKEMEFLSNDRIYEETVNMVARMFEAVVEEE